MMTAVLAMILATGMTSIEDAKRPVETLKNLATRHAGLAGKGQPAVRNGLSAKTAPGFDSLVHFSDQFVTPGFDSNGNPQSVWPYTMVGRAPESNRTTVIPAPIIPVVLDLLGPDGKVAFTFDPSGFVRPVLRSPMFEPFQYSAGYTQFGDGMMRTQFWNRFRHGEAGEDEGEDEGGYHVYLDPSVKTTRRMSMPFGFWLVFVDASNTPVAAVVDAGTFGNNLFPGVVVDDSTPIGAAELAGEMTTRDLTSLLFNNVFLMPNNDIGQCCILGFHSYDVEPGDAKNGNRERRFVMNYSSWVATGLFLGGAEDIATLSHEISEAFDDPFVDNATPWWLSTDPIFGGICQNNLETGDVLENKSSNQIFAVQMHGRTYHPQNEAIFPWFAFQSPSPALHGAYSFPDETTLTRLSQGPLAPFCQSPTPPASAGK